MLARLVKARREGRQVWRDLSHVTQEGCDTALCRVCGASAGSCPLDLAQLCPVQRCRVLQQLFPVTSEGKPSGSPSPGWQHGGYAGALGNIWQWAEVFVFAAARWYLWGLPAYNFPFQLLSRNISRKVHYQTTEPCFVDTQLLLFWTELKWQLLFRSHLEREGKQQVLRWQPGMCRLALPTSFPGPLPCAQAIISPQGLTLWSSRARSCGHYPAHPHTSQICSSLFLMTEAQVCGLVITQWKAQLPAIPRYIWWWHVLLAHGLGISPSTGSWVQVLNLWWGGGRYHQITYTNQSHTDILLFLQGLPGVADFFFPCCHANTSLCGVRSLFTLCREKVRSLEAYLAFKGAQPPCTSSELQPGCLTKERRIYFFPLFL